MRVCVVGTGNMGRTLARRFAEAGIAVTFATRNPEQITIDGLNAVSIDEALANADVVVLTLPGSAVADFLDTYRQALTHLLVVDAANNVGGPTLHHAEQAAGLSYCRAFNTLGVENFADPEYVHGPADLFYSGPSSRRAEVEILIEAVGLNPVYVGDGEAAADILDGITRLWFTLALHQGLGRHLAFRALR